MSANNFEKTGERSLAFSRWHRTIPEPARFIDIDYLEFCPHCRALLIIAERANVSGGFNKCATVTKDVGLLLRKAGVPIIILTILEQTKNDEIEKFFVRRYEKEWGKYVETSPEKFELAVLRAHSRHERHCPGLRRNHIGTKERKDKSPEKCTLTGCGAVAQDGQQARTDC